MKLVFANACSFPRDGTATEVFHCVSPWGPTSYQGIP